MAIASLRSILALKPPFTHPSAAPLPANSPRRMRDLPTIAAVTAPIPIMKGEAIAVALLELAGVGPTLTRDIAIT